MKSGSTYLNSFYLLAVFILILILFTAANLFLVPAVQYSVFTSALKQKSLPDSVVVSEKELIQLKEKADLLQKKMNRLASPGKTYLIINTTENKFRLYNGNQQLRSGLCSTGSFIHLEADNSKNWIFETPKGVLTVRNKIPNPVWRKPDWAFIEEGLEPPPFNHHSRYEYGVLGDYALDLGNGYLIHGTLYQRFLGQSVTHGCIRLNDADLYSIYHSLEVGSKVYIY